MPERLVDVVDVGDDGVPELTQILAKSRDPEELKHIWVEFRKNAGDKLRRSFSEYVQLLNEAAKLNSK